MMIRKATSVLALIASCAVWVGTMALTAPQPELVQGTPYAACSVYAADGVGTVATTPGTPEWDRCMGAAAMYGEDAPQPEPTCWVEKVDSVETAEGICGSPELRPAGSLDLGAQVLVNGRPWVATVTGLEPVGAN